MLMALATLVADVTNHSAFTSDQLTSITNAITSAVSSVVDTFVGVLPVIALIAGALWGIRFILHQFNKID